MNTNIAQERQAFADLYHDEDKEILALMFDDPSNHPQIGRGETLYYTCCTLLAWIEDDELYLGKENAEQRLVLGCLRWTEERNWYQAAEKKPTPYLVPHIIYRLRVRPHKTRSNDFMLLDVLQSGIESPALRAVDNEHKRKFPAQHREDWGGDTVTVQLQQNDNGKTPAPAALATLRKLLDAPEEWKRRLRGWACDALLEQAQESYPDLEEDHGYPVPVTAESFQHIRPLSISCDSEGGFNVWFDDGGIFWGFAHNLFWRDSILVYVKPDGSFEFAEIVS